MNVLLLGQGPLPSTTEAFCSFPQLRTWSILKHIQHASSTFGWEVQTHLLNMHSSNNVLTNTLLESLRWADVIVTAGPHYPLFILPHIDDNTPVWVDFPSDPFADRDAKHTVNKLSTEEWNLVTALRTYSLERADALGVVSQRHRWVCYGNLLEREATQVPIHYTPIAFDFPSLIRPQSTGTAFLLAGSSNSWLDLHEIHAQLKDQTVHCTGWSIPGYSTPAPPSTDWIMHDWLAQNELDAVVKQCQFGVWADRLGIESTLGSRTRALFYLWNGLTPVGTLNTELAVQLYTHKCMRSWTDKLKPINIEAAQEHCTNTYGPSHAYEPLIQWLRNPTRVHRNELGGLASDNLRLREALNKIHESITWRIGSRLHRLIYRLLL